MTVRTQTIHLIKMCGTESAQVLATCLPRLLQQAAPGASLQTTTETPGDSRHSDTTLLAAIVLLPAEPSLRRAAWYRFHAHAPSDIPILPVVVGDLAAFAERLPNADEEFAAVSSQPRKRAAGELGDAFRGLAVLPAIRVTSDDARIEHGGHFHLEREVARDLEARLKSLVALGRIAFAEQSADDSLPPRCVCPAAVGSPASLKAASPHNNANASLGVAA